MADSPDLVADARVALAPVAGRTWRDRASANRGWVLLAAAILGVVVFATGTYLLIRSAHDEIGASLANLAAGLRSLERIDAQWQAAAMRARIDSSPTRSVDAAASGSVERIRDRMLGAGAMLTHEAALQGDVAELANLLQRKADVLDQFGQIDAGLKGSLRHLSSALNDLVNGFGADAGGRDLIATAQTFVQRVLHAASTGDADANRAARRILEQLRSRPQLGNEERTGGFLHHAGRAVEQLDRFEALLAQIDAFSLTPRATELDATVGRLFDAHLARRARDRLALALLCTLLVLALAAAGWHLHRMQRGIEALVAERTRGLNSTVAQLRKSQARAVQAQNGQVAALGQVVQGIVNEIHAPVTRMKDSLQRIEEGFRSVAEAIGKSSTFVAAMASHPRDIQAVRVRYFDARAALEAVEPEQVLKGLEQTVAVSLQGVERITAVVDDLEEFACLEQGDHEAFDVNQEWDRVLDEAGETVREVRIAKDFVPLPEVWCCAEQIRRVMVNLLINACEAGSPGRPTEITLRSRVLSDAVQFQVQDNGVGIAADAAAQIFNPFYTTKRTGERTGLGLAIVKRIVESHRGSVTVRSEPGVGSVFTVVLPIGHVALAKAA